MEHEAAFTSFAHLAAQYCAWAEGAAGDADQDLFLASRFVARLYLAGLELPDPAEPEGDFCAPRITYEKYRQIYTRFTSLPLQYYREALNPASVTQSEELTVGDLCDDLADIYLELKEGLSLWETGKREQAVFCWKASFGFHWGRHATSALRALHWHEPPTTVSAVETRPQPELGEVRGCGAAMDKPVEPVVVEFSKMDWLSDKTGLRFRTGPEGPKQARLVEITREFFDQDWRQTGSVGFVLSGELELGFKDRVLRVPEGSAFIIPSGAAAAHRARAVTPKVRLFLFEDA